MQDSERDRNIKFVQDAYKHYKTNENNKIIQFLHITVLIILGGLSKCDRNDILAVYLIISLFFMPFSYGFFYLADCYGANANVNSYINIIANRKNASNTNRDESGKYVASLKSARNLCVACIILAYIYLLLGLLSMFFKIPMIIAYMNFSVCLACGLFAYFIFQFAKRFPW